MGQEKKVWVSLTSWIRSYHTASNYIKWHWCLLDYSRVQCAEDTAILLDFFFFFFKSYLRNRGMAQFLSSSIAVSSWAPHLPNFCFFMWFQAARVTKKDPLRWTLWIRSEMERKRKEAACWSSLQGLFKVLHRISVFIDIWNMKKQTQAKTNKK